MAQVILDRNCSRRDVIELMKGKNIDPEIFDIIGNKKISDLHKELRNGDALLISDERIPRLIRFAYSSKLLVQTPKGFILETGRVYGDKEPTLKRCRWTVSGTIGRGESPLDAIIRETRHEMHISVPRSEIKPFSEIFPHPEPTIHKSSVYPGILSLVIMHRYIWKTTKKLRRKKMRDTRRVSILLEHTPILPSEDYEDFMGKLLYDTLFKKLTFM